MRYANKVIITCINRYRRKTVDLSKNNTIKSNADWNTATECTYERNDRSLSDHAYVYAITKLQNGNGNISEIFNNDKNLNSFI